MADASPEAKPDHTAISVAGPPSGRSHAATRLKPLEATGPATTGSQEDIQTIDAAADKQRAETKAAGPQDAAAPKVVSPGSGKKTVVSEGLKQYMDLLNKLTDGEITELKKVFKQYDKDNSGFLDMKELGAVLKELGSELTEEEFNDFSRMVDQNKDNKIDFQEYLIMMAIKLSYPFEEDEIKRAFEVFDEDHNGLDIDELSKEMFKSLENDACHKKLVEEFVEEAKVFNKEKGGNKFDYRGFATQLLSAKSIPDA